MARKAVGQEISAEYEVRWHAPKDGNTLGLTDGRIISRRPTKALAEEFITNNGGNYATGEFSITEVKVFKTVKQVRRVKRTVRTVIDLTDA